MLRLIKAERTKPQKLTEELTKTVRGFYAIQGTASLQCCSIGSLYKWPPYYFIWSHKFTGGTHIESKMNFSEISVGWYGRSENKVLGLYQQGSKQYLFHQCWIFLLSRIINAWTCINQSRVLFALGRSDCMSNWLWMKSLASREGFEKRQEMRGSYSSHDEPSIKSWINSARKLFDWQAIYIKRKSMPSDWGSSIDKNVQGYGCLHTEAAGTTAL